jgi:hypothetical protein
LLYNLILFAADGTEGQHKIMIMASLLQYTFVSLLVQSCAGFSITPEAGISPLASATTKLAAATALPLEGVVTIAKEEEPKVGVLLLNLGGPETGDDVEGVF